MKLSLLLISLAALLTQTGCVTGQRTFSIPVPTSAPVAVTKGPIYISTVTDNRVFQNKPSDPSTPSIDGDVTSMSAAQKDRMIGRQRSGFGKAFGDIALAGNDTVTKRVRALTEEGLRRNGYEISGDPAAPTSIAISIEEFWAWMTPGFVALTFEAKIATSLTLSGVNGTARMTIRGHGSNHGQIAKNGNWQEAFEPAFNEYLASLGTELDRALPQPAASTDSTSRIYNQIKKLDELRKEKLITDEEFEVRKKKIMAEN